MVAGGLQHSRFPLRQLLAVEVTDDARNVSLSLIVRWDAMELFHALWANDDDAGYEAAMKLLDGRYTWLEEGVSDPGDR